MSLSLASLLPESARFSPERIAVISGGERVTYAQLWRQTCEIAAVLCARGVREGDNVALLMPNVPDFPRAYFAILALGAVVVPVHALLTPHEIAYVLNDSGARLIVGHPLLGAGREGAQMAGIEYIEPACEDNGSVVPVVERRPDDDAVILYTSGTTGKPKGAVLTNLNMVVNATVCAQDMLLLGEGDVLLCALPLFHSFGQTVVMNAAFRAGATVVLMARFDGSSALDLMVRENVTFFAGVPTMYVALLEAAKRDARRPPLRRLMSGGAPLPAALLQNIEKTFAVPVEEGYGLSETSPVATFNQRAIGLKPGTVGVPIWGVDVRVAAADVEDRVLLLGPGERGEIVIRGHNVFSRYLNNPEATAAAKIDGWFRSGDIGTIDDDGFITILDRKKDMILRGGFNVYPREVEEVMLQHPAIAQCAVIGVPDQVHGEEVVAVVVSQQHARDSVSGEEIVAWAREHLARHKYPRRVEFVDGYPLGPSGKILKRELVARFSAPDQKASVP